MMRAFGWLVLCLCLLAGIGYYFEWYTFSASVNKEKFKEDMGSVKDKLHGKPSEKAIE